MDKTDESYIDDLNERVRLHVKVGWLQVEYEGAASHISEEVTGLVDHVLSTRNQETSAIPIENPRVDNANDVEQQAQTPVILSTSTIATILGAETGSELALAAAAKISLMDGREELKRQAILDEMRLAPAFYKKTFSNNLTKSLGRLVKQDRLRLTGPEVYAISAKEKASLKQKLDDGP